jgi:hypothetical protein
LDIHKIAFDTKEKLKALMMELTMGTCLAIDLAEQKVILTVLLLAPMMAIEMAWMK